MMKQMDKYEFGREIAGLRDIVLSRVSKSRVPKSKDIAV